MGNTYRHTDEVPEEFELRICLRSVANCFKILFFSCLNKLHINIYMKLFANKDF